MARVVVLFFLVASSPNYAFNLNSLRSPKAIRTMRAVITLGFLYISYAYGQQNNTNGTDFSGFANDTNATDNSGDNGAPILATTYFVYWSTILGDVYGLPDLLTPVFDWLAGWVAYRLGPSRRVRALNQQISQSHADYLATRQEEIARSAAFCQSIIAAIDNGDIRKPEVRQQLIQKVDELKIAIDDEFNGLAGEATDEGRDGDEPGSDGEYAMGSFERRE